eukprot:scaffold14935_cov92-Skeletonema_dohrnii-CCMP3373.AAC.1
MSSSGSPQAPQLTAISYLTLIEASLFYADDGYIASTDAGLLQRSVDVLTALFDRVGLKTNVAKTKVMTCVDARIRVRQSDEVYYNSRHGFRSAKEWRRRRVECD